LTLTGIKQSVNPRNVQDTVAEVFVDARRTAYTGIVTFHFVEGHVSRIEQRVITGPARFKLINQNALCGNE
jgi:hypothetical protein